MVGGRVKAHAMVRVSRLEGDSWGWFSPCSYMWALMIEHKLSDCTKMSHLTSPWYISLTCVCVCVYATMSAGMPTHACP